MKAPDKKDLTQDMAELLRAHEEPYESGAWETFLQHRRKKKTNAFRWIGYAAAIVILLSVSVVILKDSPVQPGDFAKIPELKKAEEGIDLKHSKNMVAEVQKAHIKTSAPIERSKIDLGSRAIEDAGVPQPANNIAEQIAVISSVEKQEAVRSGVSSVTADDRSGDVVKFLESESRNGNLNASAQPSKWDFGVELLPTILDSKLNLGAGLTTAYRISKRFSVSTGIAYVALDAQERVTNPPVSLMSNKRLTTIDANIRAIDIPFALTYHVNKRLYTSVGVSYFNVLSEQRSNNYITQMDVSRTMANPVTGTVQTFQTTLAEANIEPAAQQPLDGNSYLGFFNFSIGHVQPLYKNHKIVLEPFLKIPLGKLSEDDLKLSNGGIKLRYSF